MSHRIACFTLFNITKTGVLNRARPSDDVVDISQWMIQRNTQCNFDTILQVISLRAQPDVVSFPKVVTLKTLQNHEFGNKFKDLVDISVWTFDFEIQQSSVFDDGMTEFGYLYRDAQNVPMVKCIAQYEDIGDCLDSTNDKRNIYFVKY